MTDQEPTRSDDETRADEVRRRLVETVHGQLREIAKHARGSVEKDDEPERPAAE